MIAGLGEAARLVCENLSTYSSHMETVRDHLEEKLKVIFHSYRTRPNIVRVTVISGASNQPIFHQRLPAGPSTDPPTCLID
jgi:cysteine sulfinate desulfinase/cysteine desulfurase-like protein